jgi:queuine tRNA-ribosyltransferase
LNLRNASFRRDQTPLDPTCPCEACTSFSRAYLHHLFKAGEMLAHTLVTIHNIQTMNRVMSDVRAGLRAGSLDEARAFWLGGS